MSASRVYVVSGGMGSSGEQVARTALAQFRGPEPELEIVAQVRTADELRAVVEEAAAARGVILHTLVDRNLRGQLVELARAASVVEVDLMGPVLCALTALLDEDPLGRPGLYRQVREDYFRRIEAIEYAVRHDDGRHFEELDEADIVLIGVSRVGKTPLSMYLAMRGYRTANLPLVRGLEVPTQLFEVAHGKVVGLTVEPESLVKLRRRRQRHLGSDVGTYASPSEVVSDLEHAREVFRRGRFATIDVTAKPIEESAVDVVAVVTGH